MLVATGSYTGNGTDNRSITGVGFAPQFVIVRRVNGSGGDFISFFKTSTMTGDSSAFFSNNNNVANEIQSLDADGFQVGQDSSVNASSARIVWYAFRENGFNDFKTGSYVGDGSDSRSITGIGFQPDFVWVKGSDSSSEAVFRHTSDVGDISHSFLTTTDFPNAIQAFESDGFQVGTDAIVNTSGKTYHYIAMRTRTGIFGQGTFTGNGLDNRNITGLGFQPEIVFVKNDTTSTLNAYMTIHSTPDTAMTSAVVDRGIPSSDRIQAFAADGFQVGTSDEVNKNTNTIMWMAWNKSADQPTTTSSTSSSTSTSSSSSTSTSSSTSSTSTTTSSSTSTSSSSSSTSSTTTQSHTLTSSSTSTSTSSSTSSSSSTSTSTSSTTTGYHQLASSIKPVLDIKPFTPILDIKRTVRV